MQTREEVIEELSDWIDNHTIAKTIVENLSEESDKINTETCKAVWLDFLEYELHRGLQRSIDALSSKGVL